MRNQTPKSLGSARSKKSPFSQWICRPLFHGGLSALMMVALPCFLAAQTSAGHDGASGSRENSASVVWRRATKVDCDAEYERQLKWMREGGWCCDPPISMGIATFSLDLKANTMSGFAYNPCGYVSDENPPRFRSRWVQWKNGEETELTQEDYYRAGCIVVTRYDGKTTKQIYPKPEWKECRPTKPSQ